MLIRSIPTGSASRRRVSASPLTLSNFCFYGPPDSLPAEIMQFLPRLVTAIAITTIYILLLRFLNRPELCRLYLSPEPPRHALNESPSMAPWERITLPHYAFDRRALPLTMDETPVSLALASTIPIVSFAAPRRPPPSTVPAAPNDYFPAVCPTSPQLPPLAYLHCGSDSVDLTAAISMALSRAQSIEIDSESTLPTKKLLSLDDEEGAFDFRAMLEPSSKIYHVRTRQSGSAPTLWGAGETSRPSTPQGEIQSMASFMNKRTSAFLIWFPFTVSCLNRS